MIRIVFCRGIPLAINGKLTYRNHPWAGEKPTFGEAIINGSTAVGVTTNTQSPIVRESANLTTNSAALTGQLVDAGQYDSSDPEMQFSLHSIILVYGFGWMFRMQMQDKGWFSYDDANVTQPSDWNPGMLSLPFAWTRVI